MAYPESAEREQYLGLCSIIINRACLNDRRGFIAWAKSRETSLQKCECREFPYESSSTSYAISGSSINLGGLFCEMTFSLCRTLESRFLDNIVRGTGISKTSH